MKKINDIIIVENIQDFDNLLPKECVRSLAEKPLYGKEKYSKLYHTTSLNSFKGTSIN